MTSASNEKRARKYASERADAYVKKMRRPISALVVTGVYGHAYRRYMLGLVTQTR